MFGKNMILKDGDRNTNVFLNGKDFNTVVDQDKHEPPIESIRFSQLKASRRCPNHCSESCATGLRTCDVITSNLMNSHLQKLFRSKALCDLDIKVGDRVYGVHKVALTSHSEKYLTIFGDPAALVSEICIEGVAPEVVEQVLEYLYTSDIDIRDGSVSDIISICNQLDLKGLKQKCKNFLGAFNEKNVFHFLRLSRCHGMKSLTRKMQDFVAQQINSIRLGPHFGFLDIEDVCAILSSDTAHQRTKSEKNLLRIGVKWLKSCKQSEVRRPFAAKIFECIALDKVHPKEICKQVNDVAFVLDNGECLTILRKAFRHHACLAQNKGRNGFDQNSAKKVSIRRPLFEDGSQSIVVIGGVGDTQGSLAGEDVLKLSLSPSKWTKLPSLLSRRSGHGAAFVNGCLFVIGGYIHLASSPIPKPTEIVDCYNDAIACWHGVSSMRVKRALFSLATTEDGHIYVFGGETEVFRPTESCECYSVKPDQWTTIVPLSIGRMGASACQHHGLIYLVGGIIEETVLPLVESYDLTLKRWNSRCPLPYGRCYGSLVQNADSLFYVGGVGYDKSLPKLRSMASVFEYHVLQDRWMERNHLPNPRHFMSTVVLGSKVYVIGGFSTETWEYLTDVVCVICEGFSLEMSFVASLPLGLIKAAAVGINLQTKKSI